jgi:predicted phosphodiesterase
MRVAVISDIHANLHALESVLDAIDAESPDAIWCLGDLVGYGPRPNECCAIVRERADVSLVGNHDLASLGRVDIELFNYDAAAAARWTQTMLDDDARNYLEGLAPSAATEQAQLFHASPRDPVWDYVLGDEAALASFLLTTAELVLVGHSHVALALAFDGGLVSGGLAPAGTERRLDDSRVLLNPGAVGQPRDGDPRAAWLLLDFERMFGSFRRVAYPIERTQDEMRAAGLPEALATRLASGE